jgi:hypothetical protein
MKLLSALVIFALALGLSTKSLASTGNEAQSNTPHSEGEQDEGHKLQGEMRKLYPQPKADIQNSVLPGKVQLVEPAFNTTVAGTAATLKWNEAADTKFYHVQVATDANFKWLKVDDHFVKGTSMEVKDLEPGHKYYWRVAGTNQEKWANHTHGYFSVSTFSTK